MKARLDKLSVNNDYSFSLKTDTYYHALNDWHYHKELEITYVLEGQGTLLIGDVVEQVNTGDMLLIGSNVPHMFKFDKHSYVYPLIRQGKQDIPLQLLTLHFDPNVLGDKFLLLPENNMLVNLFVDALKGFVIVGECKQNAIEMMQKIQDAPIHERLILFIQLLTYISISDEKKFITNDLGKQEYHRTDENRLSKVYIYTLDNFHRVIKLKEVADIIYMCPNAFCHYFKSRTNKSYFTFLMEVRISHACKLLREQDYSVVVICYESGFTNLSNFNRHFKLITGKTPLEYRKALRQVAA